MTTTIPLTELGVRDIAIRVASGELTPNDVVEAVIDRIDATEPSIQAWTIIDKEGARAQAEALTAEAKAGKLRGPLHGVPVAIKDEFHIAGMPTLMRGNSPPLEPADATVVAKLREAGAIIVGKTTMPVGGVVPPTRNPWNLDHTAGGTSSGSGAAVGARQVPLAIGEQTAGSNLRPAAYNGVAGIKPTYGRIARFGCYPFAWSRDHVGLIGIDMADLALVLSAVSGPHPSDPTALPDPPTPADLRMAEYAPPRIGVVRNFFPERAKAEMMAAIDSSASRMGEAGATVDDIMLPSEFPLTWSAATLISAEGMTLHAEGRADGSKPAANPGQRAAELIPATYYIQARRARTWLTSLLKPLFDSYDALLMPVAPGAAPYGLESTGDASMLIPWSFLGFPAATVNGGLSSKGLPLGLQFVAYPKADWELLRVGAWTEGVLGRLPAPAL